MTKPTYGSLFTGVGGFDLGFDQAGYDCRWQAEWDKHCQQTLAHHWPDIPRHSDVCDINGADLEPVDVITYGSPCQDLSVAGKRAGIEGGRSGMFFEAVRIFKEMRDATNGTFPRITIWENVPGALSSNRGDDFEAVLEALGNIGALGQWWNVLDAQYFGVPQRRRRVFLISVFDPAIIKRAGSGEILPVGTGRRRNPKKGKQEREGTSDTSQTSTSEPSLNPVLGFGHYTEDMTASAIKQRDYKDATDLVVEPNPVFANMATSSFKPGASADARSIGYEEEMAPTLNAFDNGNDTRATVPILGYDPGTIGPLTATGMTRARGTETVESNHVLVFTAQRVGELPRIYEDITPSLLSRMGTGGNNTPMIAEPATTVRRLTPIECERLMGWPDNHTLHRADGKTNSDSTRYKMCGNGVATPVAQWIAKHLLDLL